LFLAMQGKCWSIAILPIPTTAILKGIIGAPVISKCIFFRHPSERWDPTKFLVVYIMASGIPAFAGMT
jgi:hypothetical protein